MERASRASGVAEPCPILDEIALPPQEPPADTRLTRLQDKARGDPGLESTAPGPLFTQPGIGLLLLLPSGQ